MIHSVKVPGKSVYEVSPQRRDMINEQTCQPKIFKEGEVTLSMFLIVPSLKYEIEYKHRLVSKAEIHSLAPDCATS